MSMHTPELLLCSLNVYVLCQGSLGLCSWCSLVLYLEGSCSIGMLCSGHVGTQCMFCSVHHTGITVTEAGVGAACQKVRVCDAVSF
jgi:hypothetical protein